MHKVPVSLVYLKLKRFITLLYTAKDFDCQLLNSLINNIQVLFVVLI